MPLSFQTTIPLSRATRERLKALGRKGETYDSLVNRLLDHVERCASFRMEGSRGETGTLKEGGRGSSLSRSEEPLPFEEVE